MSFFEIEDKPFEKKIISTLQKMNIKINQLDTPMFLFTRKTEDKNKSCWYALVMNKLETATRPFSTSTWLQLLPPDIACYELRLSLCWLQFCHVLSTTFTRKENVTRSSVNGRSLVHTKNIQHWDQVCIFGVKWR